MIDSPKLVVARFKESEYSFNSLFSKGEEEQERDIRIYFPKGEGFSWKQNEEILTFLSPGDIVFCVQESDMTQLVGFATIASPSNNGFFKFISGLHLNHPIKYNYKPIQFFQGYNHYAIASFFVVDRTWDTTNKLINSVLKFNPQQADRIIHMLGSKMILKDNSGTSKLSLNIILFGPPGTGKTYNTKIRAVKALEEGNNGNSK